MNQLEAIEKLRTAFHDGTTDEELTRLVRYADGDRPFLCGGDSDLFSKDDCG